MKSIYLSILLLSLLFKGLATPTKCLEPVSFYTLNDISFGLSKSSNTMKDWLEEVRGFSFVEPLEKQKKPSYSSKSIPPPTYVCYLKEWAPYGSYFLITVYFDWYLTDSFEFWGLSYASCERAGVSSGCVALLESGLIDQSNQSFLNDCQLEHGWFLPCVTYPLSNIIGKGWAEDFFSGDTTCRYK